MTHERYAIESWFLAPSTYGAMSASGYLGDKHPGQWLPFWQKACCPQHENATWQSWPSAVHELPMPLNMPSF